jgi:hypothetical protein
MSKNNETVDRVQMVWNMIGGDSVVDAIKAGQAKIVVEWLKQPEIDLSIWTAFYQKYFGITIGLLRGLKIPLKPMEGNWRLLVIPQGLTNNQVYDACARQFPCWRYNDNLDKAVPTNERDPKNGGYAVWVRDTVEADPVHKNKSADMISEAGLKTETLLERMVHELVYFSETLQDGGQAGKHLDVNNVTLCSGWRNSRGVVPNARWLGSKFQVDWCITDGCDYALRSREVVS